MFRQPWVLAAIGLALLASFSSATVAASVNIPAGQAAADPKVHEGMVISASTGQISIRGADGKEHSFKTNDMTRITVNGKPGKLEDLQAGIPVRVMTDGMNKVTAISTIDDRK